MTAHTSHNTRVALYLLAILALFLGFVTLYADYALNLHLLQYLLSYCLFALGIIYVAIPLALPRLKSSEEMYAYKMTWKVGGKISSSYWFKANNDQDAIDFTKAGKSVLQKRYREYTNEIQFLSLYLYRFGFYPKKIEVKID